ncbi:MAG: hypothetical protein PHI31_10990 [Desulfuromonadaceae bacterium]|nr:hypothetical protein [Desulfuromonadaceae bacterium]
MKRFFSHIILFALLVISPVSFSTSTIPNFYILVTINAPPQESRKSSITVAHRVQQPVALATVTQLSDDDTISLPTLPAIEHSRKIKHGRAPPATPPV